MFISRKNFILNILILMNCTSYCFASQQKYLYEKEKMTDNWKQGQKIYWNSLENWHESLIVALKDKHNSIQGQIGQYLAILDLNAIEKLLKDNDNYSDLFKGRNDTYQILSHFYADKKLLSVSLKHFELNQSPLVYSFHNDFYLYKVLDAFIEKTLGHEISELLKLKIILISSKL